MIGSQTAFSKLQWPTRPALGQISSLGVWNLIVALAYYLVGDAEQMLAAIPGHGAPLSPSFGIAFATFVVAGHRLVPGIALGAILVALVNAGPGLPAMLTSAGNLLAPFAGACMVQRLVSTQRKIPHSPCGVLRLMVAAYACSGISATMASLGYPWEATVAPTSIDAIWLSRWLGDALGVVAIAPAVLTLHRSADQCPYAPGHWMERGLAPMLALGLAWVGFHGYRLGLPDPYLQLYLVVPVLVWIALRYSITTVALVNLMIAAIAVHGVLSGNSPLTGARQVQLVTLNGFLAVTFLTTLVLGATQEARRRARQVMHESEARLRSLCDLSSDWYWEQDANFAFTRIYGEGLERVGIRRDLVIGRRRWELPYHGVSQAEWSEHRALLEAHKPFQDFVVKWPGEDGTFRSVSISGAPTYGPRGEFLGYRGVGKDVTKLVAAQRAVEESEQRLRTIIEANPDPVLMKDKDGRWLVANAAMRALFNLKEDECRGMDNTRLGEAHPEYAGILRYATHTDDIARDAGTPSRSEVCFTTPGGTERYFDVVKTPVRDREGKTSAIIEHAREVTYLMQVKAAQRAQLEEIRRLNEELEARVRARTTALEASNRELEAFSYSVSHDLRAPLRAVDGFSRLLDEDYGDCLDGTGRDFLARIRGATRRMDSLIDGLLRLSRLSRAAVNRSRVDLSELAAEIAAELRRTHPERDVEIVIQPAMSVEADPQLMRSLLDNLLGNAWKFTGKCRDARISFSCERRAGRATYRVEDNGAGFEMEYAQRLFSPFQRLHAASEFEGSGIGLAIVQRIVRMHGGSVWAQSSPQQGAVFHFTLVSG